MKYLILGAGGTGGCLGAYLTKNGKDVTLIARGEQLQAIRKNGLIVKKASGDSFTVHPKACTADEYADTPNVVFVCVKAYSVDALVPFLRRVLCPETIVIPLLNIYTTGEKLQALLPGNLVTDGCIYIAAGIEEAGVLRMHGDIFRVVFGVREKKDFSDVLLSVKKDLDDCGIDGVLSENIRRDALKKFSYVSAQAACGLYFGKTAGEIQSNPEIRASFTELVREVVLLAEKTGVVFDEDLVCRNLSILDALLPSSSTSMQRDIEAGKPSEIDGLIFDVVKKGRENGLTLPEYEKIAAAVKARDPIAI